MSFELIKRIVQVVLFALLTPSVSAGIAPSDAAMPSDPCELPLGSLKLKTTWMEGGKFKGQFEMKLNASQDPSKPTVFEGTREAKGFGVRYPVAALEFMDANGTWSSLRELPGTFIGSRQRLPVPFGGRAVLVAELPDAELAARAPAWRIQVRDIENRFCVLSVAFNPTQTRGPVTGFKSEPVPDWMFRETHSSPCDKNSQAAAKKSSAAPDGLRAGSCSGNATEN